MWIQTYSLSSHKNLKWIFLFRNDVEPKYILHIENGNLTIILDIHKVIRLKLKTQQIALTTIITKFVTQYKILTILKTKNDITHFKSIVLLFLIFSYFCIDYFYCHLCSYFYFLIHVNISQTISKNNIFVTSSSDLDTWFNKWKKWFSDKSHLVILNQLQTKLEISDSRK